VALARLPPLPPLAVVVSFYDDHDGGDRAPVRLGDVTVLRETDKAILCRRGTMFAESFWVPKSVVHDDSDVWADTDDGRGPGVLVVAGWWAEDRGLS